jgi:hypothetical protein
MIIKKTNKTVTETLKLIITLNGKKSNKLLIKIRKFMKSNELD